MTINERETRHERVLTAAQQIITAARTAPKAKGVDIIEIAVLTDHDIVDLAHKMRAFYEEHKRAFFLRDADNLLHSEAVVLIGTRSQAGGLNCGYCGFKTCAEKSPEIPCVFNSVDVGIALGSAAATAADLRVDSRIMYSAGSTALKYNLMPGCNTIFAIPLSISSKSPFFDREG
ncbi:MAG: DUF2148 domain-containing protein [Candidatus Symbiothrix sp.]|jgi:uncharacterized ferredoxin-like protein|nr:DUF2148 domain-containing protein [Candidatus Symbiothrix sp.]